MRWVEPMTAIARARFPNVAAALRSSGAAGVAACGLATVVAAGAVVTIGPGAVVIPLALAAIVAALAWPDRFIVVLLAAGVIIDPAEVGITGPLSKAFWELPAGVANLMPLKTNPFELMVALCAVGLVLRPSKTEALVRLPVLAWCVPVVILLGLAYGLSQGGQLNLAYHEARGLIFGALMFFCVWRMRGFGGRRTLAVALAATGGLALNTLFRYLVYLQSGVVDLPKESWFGHETGLFLALGFILGCGLLLRARTAGERWTVAAYALLMVVAMSMTGRRSGVLVLILGVLVLGWLLLPKRPVLLIGTAIPVVLLAMGYLGAYWNDGADAIGEPARAIRSQVNPDERDRSSDQYRADERTDIQRTLQESPVFGVGFGRPFTQYIALPLLDFWPLQSYTPHQNILWLWLKMGLIGASVLLGLWLVAFRRCVTACREWVRGEALPVQPMVLAAALLMYLGYGRVDLAFIGSRSATVLGLVLALALLLPVKARWGRDAVAEDDRWGLSRS